MLEEARGLMNKFIELYGFNDEVTIASSVLVDKILNKEGQNVKSQADIIYNHIVKAETDNVETIEVNYIETVFRALTMRIIEKEFKELIKRTEIEKKTLFSVELLKPYFMKEIEKWEKNVGISSKLWSEQEHKKFETYFLEKYKRMIK